jgi:hypothetical protein
MKRHLDVLPLGQARGDVAILLGRKGKCPGEQTDGTNGQEAHTFEHMTNGSY